MSSGTMAPAQSHDDYNADFSRLRNTAKEVFHESPGTYYRRYVAFTEPFPAATEDMLIGTYTHVAVLEPERWARDFVVAPSIDMRTKAGKEVWAAFSAASAGKTVLNESVYTKVVKLHNAIYRCPDAKRLLELPSHREHVLTWGDHETAEPCKCRFDLLLSSGNGISADIKTVGSGVKPQDFSSLAARRGYDRTADFYLGGYHEHTGETGTYLFIAVSKKTLDCAVYELDEDFLKIGYRRNRRIMRDLARCRETGVWAATHELRTTVISPPRWAEYQEQWEG